MKQKIFYIWILLLIANIGMKPNRTFPQDSLKTDTTNSAADSISKANPHPLDREITNNAFRPGEKLSFVIRYGFIKAGNASMEVKDTVSVNGRTAYQIVSKARSNGTFDLFFKVRDTVKSVLDAQGLFSWRFNKKLREGSYKFDLRVDYNQHFGNADVEMIRYEDNEPLTIREKKEFTLETPPYVLDILASFYFVRAQDLRIGMPVYMSNHDNEKVYDLKVIVQKRETIEVDAGKFRCIAVQPKLKGEAIFKQKGELWVWLTDDQYKIPVQLKSAVFVGSITTELTKIEGVKLPLPSQIE